jgi:caffeoyl-CoA O-methyltransferase
MTAGRIPFRVALGRTGIILLDEVLHNSAFDDNVFAKPEVWDVFSEVFQGLEGEKILPMLEMKDLTYKHGEMNIPCRDGRFLYDLILKKGFKRGLEIGTYNGYSTLWIALALETTGGSVVTIEIDPVSGQEARKNFQKAGLDHVIDSRINDAFEEIPKIEGEFDFIFIDAGKEDYGKFLKMLRDRLKTGGAIVAHNVINYARDMRDYLDVVQSDPEFETTIHRTSEEGFSVSIKRRERPTLDKILERYIEALGGREALEKLNTRICRGQFIDDRPYTGPLKTFPFEAYSKIPDRWLIIQHHGEKMYKEGFDGEACWRLDDKGLVRDDDRARSKIAFILNPQNALHIQNYFPRLILEGEKAVEGRLTYVVRNQRKNEHFNLYFDAESGLLARIGYYWELKDYREVDGVKFPFRVDMSRKGGLNTYSFDSVEHNVPIDDERFAVPEQ